MSDKFLTQVQQHHIESNNWTAVPNGAFLDLYPEDFNSDAWRQVCGQLNLPEESSSVTILYFGTKNESNEI